jgi:short-subunit dehydrogenase
VGSLASFFSLQKKQVYGATKSFIYYFSKSLRRELRKDQIFVSIVCPGGMFTNPVSRQTIATGSYLARLSSMHPEKVAPIALDGLFQKKELIVPGRINKTLVFLDRFVPRFIVRFFEERTMRRLHTPPTQEGLLNQKGAVIYSSTGYQTDVLLSSK